MIPNRADYFSADVYAETIPGLELAALDAARDAYGPAARLKLADLARIHLSPDPSRPPYTAHATVQCLNIAAVRDAQLGQMAEVFVAGVATFLGEAADGQYDPALGYGGLHEEAPRG